MKRSMLIFVLSASVLSFGTILNLNNHSSDPATEKDYSSVHTFMREQVYPKLSKKMNFSPEKSFSRCPSGFAHSIDEQNSSDELVYGTLFYRSGCSRETFCLFKFDVPAKKIYLRNNEDEKYASIDAFVKRSDDDKPAEL